MNIFYPLIRTRTCAYQGVKNIRFFGKFGMLCILVTSVLRFALLPYYRKTLSHYFCLLKKASPRWHCSKSTSKSTFSTLKSTLFKDLFKVSNRETRTMCKIYSKLTTKTTERRQCRCSVVFIINFEQILHMFLLLLLLTLNK